MAIRNKKDIEIFYKKALNKILEFRADELTIEEFTQVKRYAEKLEVYLEKKWVFDTREEAEKFYELMNNKRISNLTMYQIRKVSTNKILK